MKGVYFLIFLISCICLSISTTTNGMLERLQHPAKSDGSLSFLVVGDWGRKGAYNQSRVALQMGRIGETMNIDFVISTGDNFYNDGLTSVNDSAFQQSFTRIYTAKSLQKQWYNVLGNHDYRGNVEAQLSPVLSKIDGRWLCKRSFIVHSEIAEIFFVDTNPFVTNYFRDPKFDWRGVMPRKSYIATLLKDVESALKNSTAKWKIVVGHHAIRTAGPHGESHLVHTKFLQASDVDLYINGHDHCLQRISTNESRIEFLTSGGGSQAWFGFFDESRVGLKFYYDGQGFMSVNLNPETAEIMFYDVSGKILHKFNVIK
ncbi:Purple acid phosphatase [Thalictrum thalictroides]|uniref:Purple acid phosphatase n=1 Tax=Thalictrum thalictroides TaxID=46969 RepID=A0A7J6W7K3_THATH|nr:Purple acid phosphatase [Thalictrum thalictroides]